MGLCKNWIHFEVVVVISTSGLMACSDVGGPVAESMARTCARRCLGSEVGGLAFTRYSFTSRLLCTNKSSF